MFLEGDTNVNSFESGVAQHKLNRSGLECKLLLEKFVARAKGKSW